MQAQRACASADEIGRIGNDIVGSGDGGDEGLQGPDPPHSVAPGDVEIVAARAKLLHDSRRKRVRWASFEGDADAGATPVLLGQRPDKSGERGEVRLLLAASRDVRADQSQRRTPCSPQQIYGELKHIVELPVWRAAIEIAPCDVDDCVGQCGHVGNDRDPGLGEPTLHGIGQAAVRSHDQHAVHQPRLTGRPGWGPHGAFVANMRRRGSRRCVAEPVRLAIERDPRERDPPCGRRPQRAPVDVFARDPLRGERAERGIAGFARSARPEPDGELGKAARHDREPLVECASPKLAGVREVRQAELRRRGFHESRDGLGVDGEAVARRRRQHDHMLELRDRTRRPVRGPLLDHEVDVGATGAEGADARAPRTALARPGTQRGLRDERRAAEIDLRVEHREMERRRELAVAELEQHLGEARDAGRALKVADVGLYGAERAGRSRLAL